MAHDAALPRRALLIRAAALPLLSAAGGSAWFPSWAAAASGPRVALVIGNRAYRQSPLANPTNDAAAMAKLLTSAGFSVEQVTDAPRSEMLRAIEAFGAVLSKAEQGFFYFAGHGAQLNWQNFLVPVDAQLAAESDLPTQCVELSSVLRATAGKTLVLVLDACRDNPFGPQLRPTQKGLSQIDAPADTLLAYATAPGALAADGNGDSGLYTSHLVKELAVPGVRIEDALKRVRLAVRLASKGHQIPWESTSLEKDIVLVAAPRRPDADREFEQEVASYRQIRSSKETEQWAEHLRRFPNGRLSEVVQARLDELLAAAEPKQAQPVNKLAHLQGYVAGDRTGSTNPYSAGTHPLNRKFSVGDRADILITDLMTNNVQTRRTFVVTRVDVDADRVEYNDGSSVADLRGNTLQSGTINERFDIPFQVYPAELQLGRRWKAAFRTTSQDGQTWDVAYDLAVAAVETVRVPAGGFATFRIDGSGMNSAGTTLRTTLWVVPGLNFPVRHERIWRGRNQMLLRHDRTELVSYSQQHRPAAL